MAVLAGEVGKPHPTALGERGVAFVEETHFDGIGSSGFDSFWLSPGYRMEF